MEPGWAGPIAQSDPAQRATLNRLLCEEEDRLGRSLEELEHVQRHMSAGEERIKVVTSSIERRRADGHDTALAERSLRNLIEIQATLAQYSKVILNALHWNRL